LAQANVPVTVTVPEPELETTAATETEAETQVDDDEADAIPAGKHYGFDSVEKLGCAVTAGTVHPIAGKPLGIVLGEFRGRGQGETTQVGWTKISSFVSGGPFDIGVFEADDALIKVCVALQYVSQLNSPWERCIVCALSQADNVAESGEIATVHQQCCFRSAILSNE
jgi:hypothetical protein